MDSNEIIFHQYKLYAQHKENFVNRSFHTNKFYLVSVLVLILAMLLLKGHSFAYGLTSTLIFSAAGMAICTLWWLNIDSYNFLIKVKLGKVLEEIEKQLPCQPYTQEFLAIRELRKNKKEFLFADIQKVLAILVFLLFFAAFANEVIVMIFL